MTIAKNLEEYREQASAELAEIEKEQRVLKAQTSLLNERLAQNRGKFKLIKAMKQDARAMEKQAKAPEATPAPEISA